MKERRIQNENGRAIRRTYAVEYVFDRDFDEENNRSLAFHDKEACFLGKKNILNMFCVLASDYLTREKEGAMEFYSALPWFEKAYGDILSRIKISSFKKHKGLQFNQFIEPRYFYEVSPKYSMSDISVIINSQKNVDLNLWQVKGELNSTFFQSC